MAGTVGAYQDSPALVIGNHFGVPLKLRLRSKADNSKTHESGEFLATQVFKWQVTYCGGGNTDGFVTLGQVFPASAHVDCSYSGVTAGFDLPGTNATGQSFSITVANNSGQGSHNIHFTSV